MGKVEAYKCDKCGCVHENPANFREIVGNIIVPDQGGLVGNNIFTQDYDPEFKIHDASWVENRRMVAGKLTISTESGKIRVYSSTFCIPCFLDVSGITQEGDNKYSPDKEAK